MKVLLAYPDGDLDPSPELPENEAELRQDLGLDVLCVAMAAGDRSLFDVAQRTLLTSLDDPDTIRYRQAVLADCLRLPDLARSLYGLAVEAIERERRVWGFTPRLPESLLHRSVDVLGLFVELMRRLRAIAEEHEPEVQSEGFKRLFGEIRTELDDAYLHAVEEHLERLRFRNGIVLTARLGAANRGTDFVLCRRVRPPTWRERIGMNEPDSYAWELPERDEAGAQALGDLKGHGVGLAANALARSTDHILSYFRQLRVELGFYVGCLNLHDVLEAKAEPSCMPDPLPPGHPELWARDLYDMALSLSLGGDRVVGSDVDADERSLLVITGANRGGKSTFLRGLGQAQLLMQAGMFVPARSFRADVRRGLFTHFKREEEATLQSGKFDEELTRMSSIVDAVSPTSFVLLNESFASTNEREGSEIGHQIVRALLEAGVKVAYVTHMYDLASQFHRERDGEALFLRAEWLPGGTRTFRILHGEPQPTSHGQDIYRRIFVEASGEQHGETEAGGVA